MQIKRLCVFCGSSIGARPQYAEAAAKLADAMMARNIGLVYGGGSIGLMGRIADAMLARDGEVIGVIPWSLCQREVGHSGLSELLVVDTMHERKARMAELADGFVALPGGIGTLEEFFEIWSWSQLGIHAKPSGLINTEGYFDPLLMMIEHMTSEHFIQPRLRDLVTVGVEPSAVLDALEKYQAPAMPVWLRKDQS